MFKAHILFKYKVYEYYFVLVYILLYNMVVHRSFDFRIWLAKLNQDGFGLRFLVFAWGGSEVDNLNI